MKRILYSYGFIVLWLGFYYQSFAQCSSCTSTVVASSTPINVAAGTVVCVTSGTQTGSVQVTPGGTICFKTGVTVSANIDASAMNASTNIVIQSGAIVSSASSWTFNGSATGGNISNQGTWLHSGATIPSNVTFNNSGTLGSAGTPVNLELRNGANFVNSGQTFFNQLKMNNGANFVNTGQVTINSFDFNNGATFTSNAGSVTLGTPSTSLSLDGTLNINGGGLTINANSVNINSSASITTQPNTSFTVNGAVTNNGNLTLGSTNSTITGSVTNNGSGSITMNNSVLSVGGAFSNNGAINSLGTCGRINIAGSSVQNGSGSIGANTDICDTSSLPPNLFDSQAGTVSPSATRCLCNPTPLPVTWAYVEAVLWAGKNPYVQIRWATVTEEDNEAFTIERSHNTQDWHNLQVIQAKNSRQSTAYSFIDQQPLKGKIYYRIQQKDFDGKFSYSKIVVVHLQDDTSELSVAPNPFEDLLVWQVQSSQPLIEEVTVRLITIEGLVVMQQTLRAVATHIAHELPTNKLPKGAYILKITTPDTTLTQKVTKL